MLDKIERYKTLRAELDEIEKDLKPTAVAFRFMRAVAQDTQAAEEWGLLDDQETWESSRRFTEQMEIRHWAFTEQGIYSVWTWENHDGHTDEITFTTPLIYLTDPLALDALEEKVKDHIAALNARLKAEAAERRQQMIERAKAERFARYKELEREFGEK